MKWISDLSLPIKILLALTVPGVIAMFYWAVAGVPPWVLIAWDAHKEYCLTAYLLMTLGGWAWHTGEKAAEIIYKKLRQ